MYEEIEKKWRGIRTNFDETTLYDYFHDKLIGSMDDFKYINWVQCTNHILCIKMDIFEYIPFTKKDVNIFIQKLKHRYPLYAFYAITIFTDNQLVIFDYLSELLLNKEKRIPFVFIIGGMHYALNEQAKKDLVFDDADRYKFFVPVKTYVNSYDILIMLQKINNYYQSIGSLRNRELQDISDHMIDMSIYLEKQGLLTNAIKYELFKLKKKLFMKCLKFNENHLLPYYFPPDMLRQIIIDYYFIFHRKRNKNFIFKQINKWIFCQCHYDDSTKKEIQYILENIQRISFKKLNLLFDQIKFIRQHQ